MIKAEQREILREASPFPIMAEYLKIQGSFISKDMDKEADKEATSKKADALEQRIEKGMDTTFSNHPDYGCLIGVTHNARKSN